VKLDCNNKNWQGDCCPPAQMVELELSLDPSFPECRIRIGLVALYLQETYPRLAIIWRLSAVPSEFDQQVFTTVMLILRAKQIGVEKNISDFGLSALASKLRFYAFVSCQALSSR